MSANPEHSTTTASRLAAAVQELHDAMRADNITTDLNQVFGNWRDVVRVHYALHWGQPVCKGPAPQDVESAPPVSTFCELATMERANREAFLNVVNQHIREGWKLTIALDRGDY